MAKKKVKEEAAQPVEKQSVVYFVTGSKQVTGQEFMQYYSSALLERAKSPNTEAYFIVNDDPGVGWFTLFTLAGALEYDEQPRVTVYYVGEHPFADGAPQEMIDLLKKSNFSFIKKGFDSVEERNLAMAVSSALDYHVLFGYDDEDTIKQNIVYHHYPYDKIMELCKPYIENSTNEFWSIISRKPNEQLHEEVPAENQEGVNTEA